MATADNHYFVPEGAYWPLTGSVGLTAMLGGLAALLNENSLGMPIMLAGVGIIIIMCFGWFGTVIRESESGQYRAWEDKSFRLGMGWFIFSEVMFFAGFFGALFYARLYSVPWLLGEGSGANTHNVLWSSFSELWPTNGPSNLGESDFHMSWWPLPFINTAILLTSGLTCTIAHHAVIKNDRRHFILGLLATVILGVTFVYLQVVEYQEAYHQGMKLSSGIYGSTFFMLTGFHGFHVSLGALILLVVLVRAVFGHFTATRHFAFEAAAWYWHFVDVVWLGLFILVYIL